MNINKALLALAMGVALAACRDQEEAKSKDENASPPPEDGPDCPQEPR